MSQTRILIVDDSAAIRSAVRSLLQSRQGWIVCGEAQDGVEAVEKARSLLPDLILMDISMPRMSGIEATQIIQQETPFIEIVLISQNDSSVVKETAEKIGVRGYVGKGELAQDLLPAIESVLSEKSRTEKTASLLAAIVGSSDDAIVSKNLDGVITSWNNSAERIFGYKAEEAIGQNITLIIPGDRRNEETEIISRLRRGERVDHFETLRLRKDGTTVDVSLTISPVKDLRGRVIGASKVARDVTPQKKAERVLAEHQDRFELVAQALQIGFWFCDLPFDKLIWDNRVKEHFWLPPDAEVRLDTFYSRLHPDDRERARQAIENSITTNSPYDIEYRSLADDGCEKWIRAMGRTFYDESGRPTRFDGLTLDITDRKLADERERQITAEAIAANAKFRAVFEQTTQFAGILTNDGVTIDVNKLCLEACGYAAQQVLGRLFWDTPWWSGHVESREKIRESLPKAAQGIPCREVLHYSWADGTERLVDFALYPILDHDGKVIFLHPTGVDITDTKRTEENYRRLAETLELEVRSRTLELEKRNLDVLRQSHLLRAFSQRLLQTQDEERRHIARELHDSAGQTLTVLGINLARFIQKAARNPDLASDAEKIQESVQQLHREIRTTSYLLHPPLLDESGLQSALSWYIQGLIERSGLEIELSIPDEFGRLPRDVELVIFRLVQECLTNIHRHSQSKTAAIRLAHDRRAIRLEIEDRGRGITAEKLAEIQSQASGVGIRGMRERLAPFDGVLHIESNSKGTRVLVSIPVSQQPAVGQVAAGGKTQIAV